MPAHLCGRAWGHRQTVSYPFQHSQYECRNIRLRVSPGLRTAETSAAAITCGPSISSRDFGTVMSLNSGRSPGFDRALLSASCKPAIRFLRRMEDADQQNLACRKIAKAELPWGHAKSVAIVVNLFLQNHQKGDLWVSPCPWPVRIQDLVKNLEKHGSY